MSDLNDSVIICDTLPSPKQRKTMSPKKEKKQAVKTKKKTFYECSLRQIQLSGKQREQQLKAKQQLILNRGKQCEVENNENNSLFNVEANSLCQDSIIVLSDNESEKDKDVCDNKGTSEKRYMERFDNNSNRTLKQKRSPFILRSRKRKAVCISDSEDSDIDNQSIVFLDSVNQSAEDIVVVWSSKNIDLSDRRTKKNDNVKEGTTNNNLVNLEKDVAGSVNEEKRNEGKSGKRSTVNQVEEKDESGTVNEEKRNKRKAGKEITVNQVKEKDVLEEGEIRDEGDDDEAINITRVEDNRLFMIDCSPDPKNLHCLITAKRYKENVKNNDAREVQMNNAPDLIFNQKYLRLPIAENISNLISMNKPKSTYKFSAKLRRRLRFLNLNQKNMQPSTSSVQTGSTSVLPEHETCPAQGLREIVIDGNNVAMAYTNGKSFSEKGIKLVIDFFISRGHTVKVFVPQYRRALTFPLLEKWYTEGIVVFTPSRTIGGKRITPYDDRYILQYATMCKGIVVSSDQFRDLYSENPEWRDTIENRLLAPTFVGNIVMFPNDPLGRVGPSLEKFLMF